MKLNSIAFLLAQAAPAGASANPMMQQIPFMLFIGVIFYFLLIRPQQKQKKAHQLLISSLKTGDKVVTSSGIHGIVANVKDRTFLLKIADNVKIEFDRAAVTSIERDKEEEI
ncbi:MAG: preprotein translocase subunit YajC [Chthoniobacterales bacterium]